MKYQEVSRKRREKLTKAGLSGGLNVREMPFAVADDQLTDCQNLWWRNGVLCTRPALRATDVAVSGGTRTYTSDGLVMRQTDEGVVTGDVRADGTVHWNTAVQTGTAGFRVRCDVSRLEGWNANAGAGDGTLLFLANGRVTAPLSAGGYQPLDDQVYVPLGLKDGIPTETGTPPTISVYEPLNLLTSAFRASFVTDGQGKYFHLPFQKRAADQPITAFLKDADGLSVRHTIPAGQTVETAAQADGLRMRYGAAQHCLFFVSGEAQTVTAPPAAGETDCLVATLCADGAKNNAALIGGMTFGCWFGGESSGLRGGNRLFVGGNSRCPNRIYWSDADRPLYFPADNFLTVGDAGQAVTAFGKQDDMLVIFKERELYALTYRARTATADPDARFPLMTLHGEVGCDCPATVQLCRNRLVWLTQKGEVYALVSGSAYSQSNVRVVSGTVAPLLKQAGARRCAAASAGYYDGCYCLLVEKDVLLLDCGDAAFARTDGDAPWYRWSFDKAVIPERLLVCSGVPVLMDAAGRSYTFGGTADRIVTYNGIWEQPITGLLCTKLFDFGYSDRLKTVYEVSVAVGMPKGGRVQATYITERGRRQDCRTVSVPKADERAANFLNTVRFTPHVTRARRFALELSVSGSAALETFVIRYAVENATEKGSG